ncbi:uncharacterized protein LOC117581982 isoform X3 [Drosophila guanche]|uniref:N-acetyltransferase domain-containing protein n=1 Tax=Drosophila guanche TaxID=7266 RepID=A0A3B0JEF2_DROGU|nr:uncharacterized protein LOC117581982 isoform X3 [Drosophila guanche]SPP79033.1 Hypothetical predicted protein [Drosophila guanche]
MCVKLKVIGLSELEEYQKLYTQNWPKYCPEYYCLDNFIEFLKADPQIKNLKLFTLAGEQARADALFVIVDRYQLFVGSLNNTNGLLQQALELLDWSAGFKCSSIPSRHIQAVDNVVQSKQLELEFRDPTNLFYMKAEDALKLKVEPSAGFILKSLSVTDAPLINEEWPNHHLGSLYFIQRQIRMCVNAGLYAEDSKELVAWCIRLQGGYLGALQVKSGHERRGFGTLVTREISHRLGTQGHDVMALVGPSNKPSAGMFSKLGFRIIDQCYWLRTMPTNGELTWSEGE